MTSLADCNPGVEPFEFNVLILPDSVETKTAGGIILTAQSKDTQELAGVRGLLAAVSPAAFSYHDWPEGTRLPQKGDRVIFAKYAGTLIKGDDGQEYRIVKDRDVIGVIAPAVAELRAVA